MTATRLRRARPQRAKGDAKMPEKQIPEYVIDALLAVRSTAAMNMFDRKQVIACAKWIDPDAWHWLKDATDHEYMDALNAMGKRVGEHER